MWFEVHSNHRIPALEKSSIQKGVHETQVGV